MQNELLWQFLAACSTRTLRLSLKRKTRLPRGSQAAPREVFHFGTALPAIVAYASCVQRSSVVLVIALSMLSGYTVVTTNRKEHGRMEQKKNLCAQIPLSLHTQVSEAREAAGQTTSEYITNLLIEYYKCESRVEQELGKSGSNAAKDMTKQARQGADQGGGLDVR